MQKAEISARQDTHSSPAKAESDGSEINGFRHANARPILVWVPLAILAGVLCWQLVPLGFPLKPVSGSLFRAGLSSAYFSAAVTLITLMALLRVRPVLQSIDVYLKGMTNMTLVAVTLLLAWVLSDIGRSLGADVFISGVTEAALPVWLLPAVIFVLSAMLSFATGSSWGTFAIMFPLVIPTASLVGAPLYACMGAVLSGGLFGDHSSPISETTILSSTGAGCAQIEHFRTQLPYAFFNGMISLVGFLLAGMHSEYWILLMLIALQIILLMSLQRLIKRGGPDRRGRFTLTEATHSNAALYSASRFPPLEMIRQNVWVRACPQAEHPPTCLRHFILGHVERATLGSERTAGDGLNPRHHGAQTIASGGREMIEQLQFSKVRVDIKIQNVLRVRLL